MRLVRGLLVFIFGAIAAAGAAYFLVVRPQVKAWGADPLEAELPLPGDGLLPAPSATETRGITIAATPTAV